MPAPVAPVWASPVVYVDTAIVVGAAVAALLATRRKQGATGGVWVAAALVAWLGLAVALGAAHVFEARTHGIPWIGLGVAGPIVVGLLAFRLSPTFRRTVESIPQPWLLAIQFPRVVGVVFLVLLAGHRLPAVFAHPAGWGDILVGATAPLVAYAYARGSSWSRPLAVAFNLLGIADFVVAVGTGFLAAPSAFRVFLGEPSTSLMSVLPLVVIPTFLVPFLTLVQAASLRALLVPGRASERSGREARQRSAPVAGRAGRAGSRP